ncbi:unnamed protein product [Lactuca virosa]|uniref:Uncharacterized protein n=1 Tax=Lactuca virosa TaxID=75947 RepID=A0AAU9MR72_9ASTR|nr:unnamed protein product [Lactuca virosa]
MGILLMEVHHGVLAFRESRMVCQFLEYKCDFSLKFAGGASMILKLENYLVHGDPVVHHGVLAFKQSRMVCQFLEAHNSSYSL